ncbi:Lrp/AsnC family transcriptional regulator [Fibrobacter sp. UWB11]|uniref:Lrp/AsnC family transcriptional regulator n=1 Tax=Fibrobacter sp. UWB11 TaxID=1896202 RepID=UPI000927843C|nr:Lrp/AsnC family transcriptional regulator [Fibrobacter sp. UWB11]SIO01053.1 transcriptional regulator, AsnC family [Fibrobacter sp. UWB11]
MLCQKLLAIIQDGFPLVERPYKALAEMLNVSEQEVFDEVEKMRASGVIRRIGGVYDSKKLGFISRLCAGMVPASEKDFSVEPHEQTAMEKFAAAVNDEHAITHNYIRSHKYNVWFTVIAENESEILTIVDKICAVTELRDVHVLTATKKYKINTVMGAKAPVDCDCKKNDDATKNVIASHTCSERQRGRLARQSTAGVLTEVDKSRIRTACDDIPHTLTPFKDWGVSCDELRKDIEAKRMRRFGAILRHQDAGFPCNAMVCFRLNEEPFADSRHSDNPALRHSDNRRLEESSKILDLAKKHFISHCYERPTFEGFPYNVYAMMHAQTPEELDGYIKESAALLGNPEYVVLHSLKELKKTSFKFFA